MKKKILFILSSIFTILAIIGFIVCMIYAVSYFIELATPPTPCTDSTKVCIQVEAEPLIMIIYLIFGVITVAVSAIGTILSGIIHKTSKLALIEFIVNLAIIIIVIALFVIMLLTVN